MGASNVKAMREALDDIGNACAWISANCNDGTGQTQKYMDDIISIVRRALSAPPRNCDLGTEEEQDERFFAFCNSHKCPSCPCRFIKKTDCALIWAHMPYDGETDGSK